MMPSGFFFHCYRGTMNISFLIAPNFSIRLSRLHISVVYFEFIVFADFSLYVSMLALGTMRYQTALIESFM